MPSSSPSPSKGSTIAYRAVSLACQYNDNNAKMYQDLTIINESMFARSEKHNNTYQNDENTT